MNKRTVFEKLNKVVRKCHIASERKHNHELGSQIRQKLLKAIFLD